MRRRLKRSREEGDLDITAFMNLMIVLVPILLINMIFSQVSVMDLNFPDSNSKQNDLEEELQLQVIILDQHLLIADNKGGVIKKIENLNGDYDFGMLGKVMKDIKLRVPDKKDVTIMAKKSTSYQTLVTVMDTVRSFPTVVAGSLVNAELFPDVSISDAPELVGGPDELAKAETSGKVKKVES